MLYEAISHYTSQDICPMHMPGHKRNTDLLGDALPYGIDITELDGFDNLHQAEGILKDVSDAAAALYGSRRSFLLVNGSTAGILSAVRAVVPPGGKVLLARGCHKSVYHAAELCALQTAYLVPDSDPDTGIPGSITPEQITAALAIHPDAALVVITSPTYEGVVSDVRSIAAVAHAQGIPLLVDQAHGAHLGFSDRFPGEALRNGADLVVASLHKTLPALTQCALAHVSGRLVDDEAVARALSVFQTSSPSYVLMASIDRCITLLSERKEALFCAYEARLAAFDQAILPLRAMRVLCHGSDSLAGHDRFFLFDPGKLVIDTGKTELTGSALARILREEYRIETEMAGPNYVIAMTSLCDPDTHFERLSHALLQIDRVCSPSPGQRPPANVSRLPQQAVSICAAGGLTGQFLPLEQSPGAIALEYIWAYPPGIPLIVPGEYINASLLHSMHELTAAGIRLYSSRGKLPQLIYAAPQKTL